MTSSPAQNMQPRGNPMKWVVMSRKSRRSEDSMVTIAQTQMQLKGKEGIKQGKERGKRTLMAADRNWAAEKYELWLANDLQRKEKEAEERRGEERREGVKGDICHRDRGRGEKRTEQLEINELAGGWQRYSLRCLLLLSGKISLKEFHTGKSWSSFKYWVLTIFVKKTIVKTKVYVICDTYT